MKQEARDPDGCLPVTSGATHSDKRSFIHYTSTFAGNVFVLGRIIRINHQP
ncbi:MAG: hypothetical protein WC381_09330 [Kiritimatiellia bacterium]|jgi:hypothetical protein